MGALTIAGRPVRQPPGHEGLVLSAVTKRFAGGGAAPAISGVDLTVDRAEFVTVIGPSGCGKSTLLRLVAGLLEPDGGAISIFGETTAAARAAKHIGLVPQSPALLPWRTVIENVELVLEVNRRAVTDRARSPEELLTSFGLGEVLHRHPVELSGGMQQRVAVARAFALAPAVLLMDEPFAALDELTRDALRHELVGQWERNQTTVVFVTHSVPEAVLLSDRVVVMSGQPGRIHAQIPIPLARPRAEGIEFSDEFRALELTVRAALRSSFSDGR